MKISLKFFSTVDKRIYILAGAAVVLLVVSLAAYFHSNKGTRREFIYESEENGSYYVESRYLPSKPVNGDINNYVDELVMGPVTERAKSMFGVGTRVNECFLRDSILYVDLSYESLNAKDVEKDYQEAFRLASKNIKYNFPKVKHVEFSVKKEPVFEGVY